LLAVDNTWGCPGLYRPLALGADLSLVAITKYLADHSDLDRFIDGLRMFGIGAS